MQLQQRGPRAGSKKRLESAPSPQEPAAGPRATAAAAAAETQAPPPLWQQQQQQPQPGTPAPATPAARAPHGEPGRPKGRRAEGGEARPRRPAKQEEEEQQRQHEEEHPLAPVLQQPPALAQRHMRTSQADLPGVPAAGAAQQAEGGAERGAEGEAQRTPGADAAAGATSEEPPAAPAEPQLAADAEPQPAASAELQPEAAAEPQQPEPDATEEAAGAPAPEQEPAAKRPHALQVPPLPASVLPAAGGSPELTPQQLSVLGAWLRLYCPEPEAQQGAALAKHYDQRARFQDNFVQVSGREQVGVQFYGMLRGVERVAVELERVQVLSGEPGGGGGGGGAPGVYQLRVVSRLAFFLPRLVRGPLTSLVLPAAVEVWATDVLTVATPEALGGGGGGADGGVDRVLLHTQRVHNVPVLPWPLRWGLGWASSLFMMHVLGW